MNVDFKNKKGAGCAVLFALPFALFGLGMGGLTCYTVWQGVQVRSWVETPAQILATELEHHDDTNRATGRFAYSFGGKRYESERISLHTGSDNIGNFHRRIHAEMKKHLANEQPLPCYVNPNQPAEAILYRDWRPGLLLFQVMFALIFGGVGFGIMGATWYFSRKQQREQATLDSSPEQPWFVREDWAAGKIYPTTGPRVIGTWAITLFWNGISWTVLLGFLLSDEKHPWFIHLFLWLFPAIGLFILYGAILQTVKYLGGRNSFFEMAEVPGVIGGRLSGVVHAPEMRVPKEGIVVTLSCMRKRIDRNSDGDSIYYEPIWQRDKVIVRTLSGGGQPGTAIPVDFPIPNQQPETDTTDDKICWWLEVAARKTGFDYQATFEVPVFKTAASSAESPIETSDLLSEYEETLTIERTVQRCGGQLVRQTERSLELYFGPNRRWSMIIATTVTSIVLWALTVFFLFDEAPWIFKIIIPVVASIFSAVTFWLATECITIRCDQDGLTRRGGVLGLGQERHFAAEEISTIESRNSGTRASSMNSGTIVYQEIVLLPHNGRPRKQKLVSGIKRRADAQRLAQALSDKVWAKDS